MEKCGFVNVQEKKFRVPFVEDPDIPEAMVSPCAFTCELDADVQRRRYRK